MDLQLVNLDNKEEEEPQGESTHPYLDYPVSQKAPEGHHENNKLRLGIAVRLKFAAS